MPGGRRGLKFTTAELESLAETVEEFVPISSTEWERVSNQHISFFPNKNQTAESLKRKFQEMVRTKMKTGDPHMPAYVRIAKWAYYAIVNSLTAIGARERQLFNKLLWQLVTSSVFVHC